MKKEVKSFETKLRKTGSAAGVTIPAEFLRKLGFEIGDMLQVSIEGEGLQVRKIDAEFDLFMAQYLIIEDRFSSAFLKLTAER